MKRKLNERDVPEASEPSVSENPMQVERPEDSSSLKDSFAAYGLEPRILRGTRDLKWAIPTPVQAHAIPHALEGRDVVARSGTGTGKTGAYLLPIINSVLRRKDRGISALILVPTKELALQITNVCQSLSAHCSSAVRIQNISGKASEVVQRARLADLPDIVVATPARASANWSNGALSFKSLTHLAIDEGDLVMGYGFKEDMDNIAQNMPKGVQVFISSATLTSDLDMLKDLFCHDPVTLELDDLEKDSQLVKQYIIKTAEDEKFLLLYAMTVLKLLKGKCIIFVGDVDRSYRVKLFLEQFAIKSVVLNSELPLASRLHIVEEFNKNIYDILVASDDTETMGAHQTEPRPQKKAKTNKQDFGVSRGIDFLNVSCVLNFDFPPNYKSYFHRIGRTARAGRSGTAISFIVPKEKYRKHKPTTFEGSEKDEHVLEKVEKHQKVGQKLENYGFDMKKLEPFRYRFTDALRSVTRIAVREARVKELRSELLKSQKLARYFDENPEIQSALRHDQNLNHPARVQQHLKHIPDYLLPGGKKAEDIGFVGLEKPRRDRPKIVKRKGRVVRTKSGKIDPLKTFNRRGRGKK